MSGQDNAASSTSIFVDYLKCILVPEQFGAFVVVANTGDHQSSQGRNIDAQMAMKSNSQERVNATAVEEGSQERFGGPGGHFSQERNDAGPGGSQERFGGPGGQFSQERNDSGPGECQDQVSNYTGNKE